jgi:hypothetical protein
MKCIAQDGAPEPADADHTQHEPHQPEHTGDVGTQQRRPAERNDNPDYAGERIGQKYTEPGQRIGQAPEQ